MQYLDAEHIQSLSFVCATSGILYILTMASESDTSSVGTESTVVDYTQRERPKPVINQGTETDVPMTTTESDSDPGVESPMVSQG